MSRGFVFAVERVADDTGAISQSDAARFFGFIF
jgi:hypothetical protein